MTCAKVLSILLNKIEFIHHNKETDQLNNLRELFHIIIRIIYDFRNSIYGPAYTPCIVNKLDVRVIGGTERKGNQREN